jgi:hypothetical protein
LLGAAFFVGCARKAEPPDFERMPRRLGAWDGSDMPLSPEILAAIGADVVINRVYRNSPDEATQVLAHLAVFPDWNLAMIRRWFRPQLAGADQQSPKARPENTPDQ